MTTLPQVPGVSRVAVITGLDRTGVEVACAIRPRGHVLQVCNGKGLARNEARLGALLEAAELACVEHAPSPLDLVWATRAELLRDDPGTQAWSPFDCGSAGPVLQAALAHDGIWMAWCTGVDLFTGAPVWIPAQAIYCPPPHARSLGPVSVEWTTNGMEAHPRPERALLHALLEAAERSELAAAMPDGWTQSIVRQRRLDWRPGSPAAALAERLSSRGFAAHLFDACPARGALGLPVSAALLVDLEGGPVPLTAGYACRLDSDGAALAALLEAAQSRLTEIHGAREDVAQTREDVEPLLQWLASAGRTRPRRSGTASPGKRVSRRAWAPSMRSHRLSRPVGARGERASAPGGAASRRAGRGSALSPATRKLLHASRRNGDVQRTLGLFEAAGKTRAAAVLLTDGAPAGVSVVKVVVPGFQRSELL